MPRREGTKGEKRALPYLLRLRLRRPPTSSTAPAAEIIISRLPGSGSLRIANTSISGNAVVRLVKTFVTATSWSTPELAVELNGL